MLHRSIVATQEGLESGLQGSIDLRGCGWLQSRTWPDWTGAGIRMENIGGSQPLRICEAHRLGGTGSADSRALGSVNLVKLRSAGLGGLGSTALRMAGWLR